jgi:hypothetical protein
VGIPRLGSLTDPVFSGGVFCCRDLLESHTAVILVMNESSFKVMVFVGSWKSWRNREIKKARSSIWPFKIFGAGNGIRTRDFNLGKVALYH